MLEFLTTRSFFQTYQAKALVLKNNTRKENDKCKGRTQKITKKIEKLKIQFSFIDFRGFPTLSL